MRRSVVALMTFMIFTLSLACTMPVCPAMAQNSKSAQNSSPPPCQDIKSSGQDQNGSPMLSSDCLGVDLFHADTSVNLAQDFTADHIDFVWTDLTTTYNLRPENSLVIRGPPFSDPAHFTDSSVYLTTQRLRI